MTLRSAAAPGEGAHSEIGIGINSTNVNVMGLGFMAGALRLFIGIEEVNCVKAKLREVDFVFHVPVPGDARDWRQVTVQVGLLHGAVNITFSVSGLQDRETIPASVLDGIQEAVTWARKNVRARDLSELDPEFREDE